MKTEYWLDQIPLWAVFALAAALVWLSIAAGAFVGSRRRVGHESDASLGTICAAMLGLLAFMLAFTFGITAERFQAARLFLLDEVNAIETTYLRARLLPPAHQDEVRRLLRQYVDNRVPREPSLPQRTLAEVRARAEELQNTLWSHAVALAEADRHSEIDALFIDSLNAMIDLQTSRLTVLAYRIPKTVWEVLFFITALTMFITGCQLGVASKRSLIVDVFMALTFAAVILLIADLDRSWEGRLRVSQQPMVELLQRMQPSDSE